MNIEPQGVTSVIPPAGVLSKATKKAASKSKPAKKTAPAKRERAKLDPATKITWLVKGSPSKFTAKWVYCMLEAMRTSKTVAQYTEKVNGDKVWGKHAATQSASSCFRWAVSKGYVKLG